MRVEEVFSLVLELIKAALWNYPLREADQDDYEELIKQSVILLTAPIYNSLQLSSELREQWEKTIFRKFSYNVRYNREQSALPIKVPYVILKGTSAAQYYPYPQYRTLGDIDIMTNRGEDFDIAYNSLIQAGYQVKKNNNREIGLMKNDVMIEIHRYFASLNDVDQAQYMDDLIIKNINSTHVLPDMVNGIVLLEHIGQHLENGLGLRQIVDWMMFVHRCLSDEKWPEFQLLAKNIGLETLAIVTTRMCELYLGLPERNWCKSANDDLCIQLMNYILDCGNFGIKKTEDSDISENAFAMARTPKAAFELLQRRGIANWEAAQNYSILRPFAWVYQAGRYLNRGLNRENATSELKREYLEAKKRNEMFDALGVKQRSKGLVVYKNGRYVIE